MKFAYFRWFNDPAFVFYFQKSGHNYFPTPDNLTAAQLAYHNNKKNNKNSKTDKSGVPEPFPPSTTKEQIFDVHSSWALDRNARKVLLLRVAEVFLWCFRVS